MHMHLYFKPDLKFKNLFYIKSVILNSEIYFPLA